MSDDNFISGYSGIGEMKMYYEIYGEGKPLVLIHGGGSTIQTTFGNLIPYLAENRKIIAMDLQAHGRTGDRETDLSFAQDADDVAQLLSSLKIAKADVFGFSNGGHAAMEIALRHPEITNKLIVASAFYKRSAVAPEFWEGFDHATLEMMPDGLKSGFLQVNNDRNALQNMFEKDVRRMKNFRDWSDEQIKSIKAPTLVINGTKDVGSVEHSVEMFRKIPDCQLAILPGEHGAYLGALEFFDNREWKQNYVVGIIEEFLG